MKIVLLVLVLAGLMHAQEAFADDEVVWKHREEVKAEYVGSGYGQGYMEYYFLTPDGSSLFLSQDVGAGPCMYYCENSGLNPIDDVYPSDDEDRFFMKKSEAECVANFLAHDAAELVDGDDLFDYEYYGRQMIITIRKTEFEGKTEVTASRVRLDPDPKARRNSWVRPGTIRGKIYCPRNDKYADEDADDDVFIITGDKKKYELIPRAPRYGYVTKSLCEEKGIVELSGEYLLWDKGEYVFRTDEGRAEY